MPCVFYQKTTIPFDVGTEAVGIAFTYRNFSFTEFSRGGPSAKGFHVSSSEEYNIRGRGATKGSLGDITCVEMGVT